ncbi:NADH-quinone oxidoreductase subunit A [Aeoliella mucimassa]|uniref:NADH-quinone oxidoreductase subunit n=1 Tax=Aeoliella mucimassa TaxID=2527972 RepID=A0A518ARW6_9BACT|nr:NADH-quinone oxidoreductase subunit A [Aeoliella mucimassa]QDU57469.1 NAD(P)H-quinone oxidoreductase subunit 3 [Aeoliella mucimassa]
MATPTEIVGFLALFVLVGGVFLFANLLIGYFCRPSKPNEEKLEIYECGEPTIGSSFVQFDLRFYVVALLFIIFDVEVAFFFPWATVFGKANELAATSAPIVAADMDNYDAPATQLSPFAEQKLRELGIRHPTSPTLTAEQAEALQLTTDPRGQTKAATQQMATHIVRTSLVDIAVFFAVLMVGFAYVWKRGDLDWVRAVRSVPTTNNSTQIRAA